jgi:hypothetical protein
VARNGSLAHAFREEMHCFFLAPGQLFFGGALALCCWIGHKTGHKPTNPSDHI